MLETLEILAREAQALHRLRGNLHLDRGIVFLRVVGKHFPNLSPEAARQLSEKILDFLHNEAIKRSLKHAVEVA